MSILIVGIISMIFGYAVGYKEGRESRIDFLKFMNQDKTDDL